MLAFVKSMESLSKRTGGKAESMSLDAGGWIEVVVGACGSFLRMAPIFPVYRKQGHYDNEGLKV